jgi:competence protein ComEC
MTPQGVSSTPVQAGRADNRPDLRLVPAWATAWAASAWATAASSGESAFAAVGCALLGGASIVGVAARRGFVGSKWSVALRARLATALLALAAAALVLASTSAQMAGRSREPLRGWIDEAATVEARGRVTADARRLASNPGAGRGAEPGKARFLVRVRVGQVTARGRPVEADVPVVVLGGPEWSGLTSGQHVVFAARLGATGPGDDAVALARSLGPPREVTQSGTLWRLADRLRAGLRVACQGLPSDAGGLLPSLVVGDTGQLPASLGTDLQTAGLTHLTAVSGANVAIVAGAALWAATRLGIRRSVRVMLALGVVAGFVLLARPQPSVLRAAVMGGVALLGLGLSRRPRGVPALAASGIVLLVVDPWLARSAGFALSCVATAALLLLAPPWTRRLSNRLPLPVAAALAVPAAAQAACGPVIVLLSPTVSTVAVPANLLAEPAVAPATVAGVLATVTAPLSPQAAHACAWLGALATGWIAKVAHVSARLPLAALPWPSGVVGALLLGVLTAVLVAASLRPAACDLSQRGEGGPAATGRVAKVVLVLTVAAAAGWFLGPRMPWPVPWRGGQGWPPAQWAVVECDVGQGAATAVRSGPDRAVLIDTGPLSGAVDSCLRQLGVRHLDLVVLTHHHADHVLGLPGALRRRDVATIMVSPLAEPAREASTVRRLATSAGARVSEGWAGDGGVVGASPWQVRWRLLAPVDPPTPPTSGESGDGTAVNESSLVVELEVGGPTGALRVMALGDLETAGQQRLLARLQGGRTSANGVTDVLVVAHHGSARQEQRLCAALAPRVALIGVGADNDYGHPALSTLAMLRECGPVVFRTDVSGHLAVVPDRRGGLSVVTSRRP